jgi:hypothetical protein
MAIACEWHPQARDWAFKKARPANEETAGSSNDSIDAGMKVPPVFRQPEI